MTDRDAQLRTRVSIVTSAAADRGWGTADEAHQRPAGKLQIGDEPCVVDARTVYQAARAVVEALMVELAEARGDELGELAARWLTMLELQAVMTGVDVHADDPDL